MSSPFVLIKELEHRSKRLRSIPNAGNELSEEPVSERQPLNWRMNSRHG